MICPSTLLSPKRTTVSTWHEPTPWIISNSSTRYKHSVNSQNQCLPVNHNISTMKLGQNRQFACLRKPVKGDFCLFSGICPLSGKCCSFTEALLLGRKTLVLINTDYGAKASAMLYSLVETAEANKLNTYKYFKLLLTVISPHKDDKEQIFLDALL